MKKSETPSRRIRLDLMSPVELAIYEAGQVIEGMAADVRLTNAQIKLSEARNLVADFIDGVDFVGQNKTVDREELLKVKECYFEMVEAMAICHKWASDDADIARIKELVRKSTEASSILSSKLQATPINDAELLKIGYRYYNEKEDGDLTRDFDGKLDIDYVGGAIRVKSHFEGYWMYRPLQHIKTIEHLKQLIFILNGEIV